MCSNPLINPLCIKQAFSVYNNLAKSQTSSDKLENERLLSQKNQNQITSNGDKRDPGEYESDFDGDNKKP